MDEQRLWPEQPFTRRDLAALGRSTYDLRRAVRRGEVRPLLRGVFVPNHLPDVLDLRVRALASVLRPDQVVVDRTAAWLHGVDVHAYAEHDLVLPVETCARRWCATTNRTGVDGRTRDLGPMDVTVIGDVHVTTPVRTALDLGCCLRKREAFAAMCLLSGLHGFDRKDLARELGRYRRRRGVIQLRELVGYLEPRIESPREAWVLLAIAEAGLPAPVPQHWIEIDGVPTYRLDFAYPRLRVCVEYNGIQAHELTREQRARDEERLLWLRAQGWIVIVVRKGDFTGEALDRWLGVLRSSLEPAYSNRRW